MRWKALIPPLIVAALVAVVTVFFLDGLVKRGIEKAGTLANGARVDLDAARVSLVHLSVLLGRLQVTDPESPMTNAVEVGSMTFRLEPKPLTWKKIIISDASITGIRTGTPRRYSGALPERRKPKEVKR